MAVLEQDDLDRIRQTDLAVIARRMVALRQIPLAPGSAERRFVCAIRSRSPEQLSASERHELAVLAWKHRRALPRGVAPSMSPNDPLSPEMGARCLGTTPTLAVVATEHRTV